MNRTMRATLVGTVLIGLVGFTTALVLANSVTEDGTQQGRIAFVSQRDGNFRIYIMNPDGSDQTRMTSGRWDWSPSWSPDGRWIAFYSGHGQAQIFKIDANDTNPTPIPITKHPEYIDAEPDWSPAGTHIAFLSMRDGNMEIYVMDADGNNQTRVTCDNADDGWPAWSPDGSRIAFTSDRDGNQEIYVVDYMTGQEDCAYQPKNLTNHPAIDISAAWSPDGTRIAFGSTRDGDHEIYTMDVDGDNVKKLTCNTRYDGAPAWSPDGGQIAFQTEEHGQRGIYVMEAAECPNGNERPLTLNLDYGPDWWGPPTITASLDIDPDTLNLKSKGHWVTAYVELPEGHDVADIDVGTVLLEDTISVEAHPTGVADHDGDGIADLMVKFSRQELIAYLNDNGLTSGNVQLTVTGQVGDTPFEGTDTIRVK